MASAAAVGVNAVRSPPRNSLGYDKGLPGEVTSAIGSKEDGGVVEEGDIEEKDDDIEENDDEHIRGAVKRKEPADDQHDGEDDPVGTDLLGDDDDEAPAEKPARRQLDDEELDSGDDVDRTDRVADQATQEQEYETQEKVMMDMEMARQPLPEPSDGEMYLLKMPDFMAIEPQAYTHTNFTPPTTDHHSSKPPSTAFSAYNTALSTIRWRHSPSDPSHLQSSARVLRWSDGSLTLQLASQPTVQYEIDGNALAPPQRNPLKPTPVSVQTTASKRGRQGDGTIPGEKFDQNKDAFTYMVAPSEATSTLRVTHKITAGLSVRQSESAPDDAIMRLQADLANAATVKVKGASGTELILIDEDPELKRIEAEKAMRESARRKKNADAALQREQERSGRALGRSGLSSGRFGGGLNASMLEDDEGTGGARPRKSGATPRKQRRRQNSIYSEDEDFGRKRFATKEDEYDEEDDFLAPSDEEEAVDDEEEDEDDGIVEEPRRERTPKRDRPAPARESTNVGEEADAEGEEDDDAPQARTKRRRIVDEDEDEE